MNGVRHRPRSSRDPCRDHLLPTKLFVIQDTFDYCENDLIAQSRYLRFGITLSPWQVPSDAKFFIVPETGTGPNHPFSGEKMTVTMALYATWGRMTPYGAHDGWTLLGRYKVEDMDHAVELTNAIQGYQGSGHSCGIYSTTDSNIMQLAHSTKTSRVLVNQPQAGFTCPAYPARAWAPPSRACPRGKLHGRTDHFTRPAASLQNARARAYIKTHCDTVPHGPEEGHHG